MRDVVAIAMDEIVQQKTVSPRLFCPIGAVFVPQNALISGFGYKKRRPPECYLGGHTYNRLPMLSKYIITQNLHLQAGACVTKSS